MGTPDERRIGCGVGVGMITVAAHAKLTVSLRVTGVRSDGYHLINAEMVTLDLADQLTIDTDGRGLSVIGRYARGQGF